MELSDTKGIRNPTADDLLRFEVDGPATIVGVGNASPMSVESYQLPHVKHGREGAWSSLNQQERQEIFHSLQLWTDCRLQKRPSLQNKNTSYCKQTAVLQMTKSYNIGET